MVTPKSACLLTFPEAPKLYTYGKIKKIHKNGLVNYPLTNPDGSLLQGVTEDPSGSESSEDDNNQGIDEVISELRPKLMIFRPYMPSC